MGAKIPLSVTPLLGEKFGKEREMKEVKFNFYKIIFNENDLKNLFGFSMKDYLNSLNIKNHLIQIQDNKAFLQKHTQNSFIFRKFKKDFLPKIGDEKGNVREIALKENEYIIEENVVYFDFDKNIILFHRNSSAFKISALQKYLRNVLKMNIILEPIYTDIDINILKETPIIKNLELKISSLDEKALKMLGFDINEIRKYIELQGIESIEIKIKAKRKHKLSLFENIKKRLSDLKIFDKFKVKASENSEESGKEIDLLSDILSVSKKIKTKNGKIQTLDLLNLIEEIYEEFEPILRTKNE